MKSLPVLLALFAWLSTPAARVDIPAGGELRFVVRGDPKTLDPHIVSDEPSEVIQYLTAGVLVRLNRATQILEPALAQAWKVSKDGKTIQFRLRQGVKFSDGTPFTADDVAFTIRRINDPALHSPIADTLRSSRGDLTAEVRSPSEVLVRVPAPIANLPDLFDQLTILSASSPKRMTATLGPFEIAEYKSGSHVLLRRNPNYWKKGNGGKPLPLLDSIRIDIQTNREMEMLRFRRGELHLVTAIDGETFERLSKEGSKAVRDLGPSLESEQLWFNQVPSAPIPRYKREWFRSTEFRRAISYAINREDLCRLVYRGHANPAGGPISPANRLWRNTRIQAAQFSPKLAGELLAAAGFRMRNGSLFDSGGNLVEFSIITNTGNKSRERMAALIQQDLAKIGVRLNVVPMDFPSLIERITRNFQYEACLLGQNVEADPNTQLNVWRSSAPNHQWNPNQAKPATAWEAEVDQLMDRQASAADFKKRKAAFDRVQEILAHQQPFIYLVHKNALVAVSPRVLNAQPRCCGHKRIGMPTPSLWTLQQAVEDRPALLRVLIDLDYPSKRQALKGVSFDIAPGEILGLIGESGSGKTSVALAILRLLGRRGARVTGSIQFEGRELLSASESEMRAVRGRKIGLVLQSPLASLNPALRVGRQLSEAWSAHRNTCRKDTRHRILEALEMVSLPSSNEFLEHYPRQLSVGLAQRVLIAMSILHQPKLLIADEPASALDAITAAEILKLFARLNRELNMAILYISHDLLSVASLCHQAAIMRNGQIVERAPVRCIFGDPQHDYTRALIAALPRLPEQLTVPPAAYDSVSSTKRSTSTE